jgi:hypothetical protein
MMISVFLVWLKCRISKTVKTTPTMMLAVATIPEIVGISIILAACSLLDSFDLKYLSKIMKEEYGAFSLELELNISYLKFVDAKAFGGAGAGI